MGFRSLVLHVLLLCAGFQALVVWVVGSHGHRQFRPWMLEDWVIMLVMLVGFGLPLRKVWLLWRGRGK